MLVTNRAIKERKAPRENGEKLPFKVLLESSALGSKVSKKLLKAVVCY